MSERPATTARRRHAMLIATIEALMLETTRLLERVRSARADLAVTRRSIEVGEVAGNA